MGKEVCMKISSFLKQTVSVLAFAGLLAGCGSSGSSGASGSGTLTLRITDAPVDNAEHVYIQFSGLEIQSAGGTRTTLYYCQDPADDTKTVVSTTPCTTPAARRMCC